MTSTEFYTSFFTAGPSRPNSLFYDESPERGMMSLRGLAAQGDGGLFRDSITSASLLLDGVDPECLVWAHANAAGCRVTLKDTGVNLTIPEGAIAKNEEIFCAILREDKYRPQLSGTRTNTFRQTNAFSSIILSNSWQFV
jgi:hypothetical protein